MGFLLFMIAATLVVVVHEMGHYIACRIFKTPVGEFSVGFGPSLFHWTDSRNTTWRLRLLPLGGFITPIELNKLSLTKQAIVAFAGPFANILPMLVAGAYFGKLWTTIKLMGLMYWLTVKMIVLYVADIIVGIFTLGHQEIMFGGAPVSDGAVGPIGMSTMADNAIVDGGFLYSLFAMIVVINVSVAFFNLLPVPYLDGGRIMFCGLSGIFGKDRVKVWEDRSTVYGAVFLIFIISAIMFRDVLKVFG